MTALLQLPLMRVLVVLVVGYLLLGCHQKPRAAEILKLSVCDLRERPDQFGGKVIQAGGWIYTDIERFGLEEPNCAVALRWPENQGKVQNGQVEKFTKLLEASKRNPFETEGQLFSIVEGKFETAMMRRNGQLVMNGTGYGGGAGSAPSVLIIQRIVCSVVAPAKTTSNADARRRCQE
jgi:hypothetical protein